MPRQHGVELAVEFVRLPAIEVSVDFRVRVAVRRMQAAMRLGVARRPLVAGEVRIGQAALQRVGDAFRLAGLDEVVAPRGRRILEQLRLWLVRNRGQFERPGGSHDQTRQHARQEQALHQQARQRRAFLLLHHFPPLDSVAQPNDGCSTLSTNTPATRGSIISVNNTP